jgi:hypothetical protein
VEAETRRRCRSHQVTDSRMIYTRNPFGAVQSAGSASTLAVTRLQISISSTTAQLQSC